MPRGSTKPWSMYPSLHHDVLSLLVANNPYLEFRNADDSETSIKEYDTAIMGRFCCRNPKCSSNGWSSKKIAITIRLYANQQYNARVYHQRCQNCNSLSKPILDQSYAERVSYRISVWSGMEMEPPPYSSQGEGPHQSDLCEGCRSGHCSVANRT